MREEIFSPLPVRAGLDESSLFSLPFKPEQLEAIAGQTRALFLEEEAPEYLALLEQGIEKLQENGGDRASDISADLIRAAHSLKGGAGMAQMPALSQLAHKLEDLLLALQKGHVSQPGAAVKLVRRSIEKIRESIELANSSIENPDWPILAELDAFLQGDGAGEVGDRESRESLTVTHAAPLKTDFVKKALLHDLEECLARLEEQLGSHTAGVSLEEAIAFFVEECTLLGQVLSLPWLTEAVEKLRSPMVGNGQFLEAAAVEAIADLRAMRARYLEEPAQQSPMKTSESARLEEGQNPSPQADDLFEMFSVQPAREEGESETEETAPPQIPDRFLKYIAVNSTAGAAVPALNVRVPVARLDRMNNAIGELLINCERLALYQEQLDRASRNLKKCTQEIEPIRKQVQGFYQNKNLPSTLQGFQELTVLFHESKADVELIARELEDSIEILRAQIESLHGDLRASRLVPFGLLSERFQASLLSLTQQYSKSVELIVEGKDTLVDRAVLEQLQAPLTHLFRNAFDHGIELPVERRAAGKPIPAKIVLSAEVKENSLAVAIADDGRGIDPQKVYRRAVEMGLIEDRLSSQLRENWELSSGEILEFIFAPGFSTAAAVSDLSGRGVGLDIVRLQVGRLRGSVQVETALSKGTKFTIAIPMSLGILPLLLCRSGQRTLAIPSVSVLEIINIADAHPSATDAIEWRSRELPLFPLLHLLPYARSETVPGTPILNPALAIILDVSGEPLAVAADALLGERELVLKPFDATVPVPACVAGCTVLGTGEVVPVLSPNQFGELIDRAEKVRSRMRNQVTSLGNSDFSLPSSSTGSILIVDDSIAVRRSLDMLLSQAGYQVIKCRDGKEALEELQHGRIDLVISDIDMPRLDGLSLLMEIRANPSTSHLPVVMLTARESESIEQQALNLGAAAYLTKPLAPDRLLAAIAALLSA